MAVTRKLARPMMAAMFVSGGVDQLKRPETKVAAAEKVAEPIAQTLHLPEDPVTLVRINGAVQVGAASLLALGRLPRVSATALAASLVPTTFAAHRFWEETDVGRRSAQRIAFLKNVSMLGGLVLAATDTEGRPSLSWRARKATSRASRRIGDQSRRATNRLNKAANKMEKAASSAANKVEKVAGTAALEVEKAGRGVHRMAAAIPAGHR